MRSWKDFVIGLVVGAALLAAGLGGYFLLGFAPVAVSASPMPFEKYFANAALKSKSGQGDNVKSPIEPTEANLLEGARVYRANCAICHSLPGLGKTVIGNNMYPSAPELLSGEGVTDDPVGRTHWVVENGIRMTGMPGWGRALSRVLSNDQLWQVSLLLSRAANLPAPVQDLLKQPDTVPVQSAASASAP